VKTPQSPKEEGESLDLICGRLEILQAERGYRFGVETLLLAGFVSPGAREMVDLGTGSGVIPMVLAAFGRVERAVGVEVQKNLASRARRSVAANDLHDRVEIIEADLRELQGRLPPSHFDLVTANPPHTRVGSGQRSASDEKAIAKQEIMCTLEDVVAAGSRLLASRASFVIVYPTGRLSELLAACRAHKLTPARLRMIHGRQDLAAKHCLLEASKSGRMSLTVEPPLIVYEKKDRYSEEVKAMLYPLGV